jgi:hypothetical protein
VPISVKVICPAGVTLPSLDARVSVTGISSCEKVGEVVRRVIRVRDASDILGY